MSTPTTTKAPAAKNPLVDTVDFSLMGHSEPKRTQGGAGIAIVYSRRTESDRSSMVFQLSRPRPEVLEDGASAKMREEALAELPSVRTGFHLQPNPTFPVKDGKHTVYFAVSEELADHVRRLDEANIAVVVKNSKEWFKRGNVSADLVRQNYSAIVTQYPNTAEVADDQKQTCLRVKVVENKTEFLVQDEENYKKFRHGDIFNLKRNSRVVLVLEDRGLYFRQTESGGQLYAKRILIMHGTMDTTNLEFDLGENMDIEIEEDFVPPLTGQVIPSSTRIGAPGNTNGYNDPSVNDQTIINGGTAADWQQQSTFAGPAVLF